jgi:hypothetical protein
MGNKPVAGTPTGMVDLDQRRGRARRLRGQRLGAPVRLLLARQPQAPVRRRLGKDEDKKAHVASLLTIGIGGEET